MALALNSSKCSAQAVDYQITISPASPILLGKTFAATIVNLQGGPATSCGWRFACNQAGNYSFDIDQPDLTKTFCARKVGDQVVGATLMTGTGNAAKSVQVVVEGPDNLVITVPSAAATSSGPPPLFVLEHKFRLVKGTTPIGPCYTACCYEKVAFKTEMGWEDEPAGWQRQWCPEDEENAYFFHSPDIFDTKTYPAPNFGDVPIGHIFLEYKQRVAVDIAKCSGVVRLPSKLMHFQVVKVSATEIAHNLVGESD